MGTTSPTFGGKYNLTPNPPFFEGRIDSRCRNFGILIAYIIFFMGAYIVAAEYISLNHSKGEVLVFQRGHKHNPAAPVKAHATDEESGTLAPGDEKAAAHGTADDKESTGPPVQIQKQKAIFHWKDVCYDIKIKGNTRRILDHVDGWVKPGTLTALMVSLPGCLYQTSGFCFIDV